MPVVRPFIALSLSRQAGTHADRLKLFLGACTLGSSPSISTRGFELWPCHYPRVEALDRFDCRFRAMAISFDAFMYNHPRITTSSIPQEGDETQVVIECSKCKCTGTGLLYGSCPKYRFAP